MTTLGKMPAGGGVDYGLCEVSGTRLQFRGPMPDTAMSYVAMLGGTDVFGKFISAPFPAMVQSWIGMPVWNLGVPHAGLSLFAEEQWLLDTAKKAEVTVLQVLGAQNMSNRLYSVHSRRNDRFLGVSPALRDLFPSVDFSEVNFTGHLLETLAEESHVAFGVLVEELKWAWVQRMRRTVKAIGTPVVLLWLSDRRPDDTSDKVDENEPLFISRPMLDELTKEVAGIVEVVCPVRRTLEGKQFDEGEEDAAEVALSPVDHARIAEALAPKIMEVLDGPGAAVRTRA